LPLELKEKVKENLQPYLDLPKVKGLINYMFAEDWSDKLEDFYKYTTQLDNSRSQSLFDIIPELSING
jgi:hypothetical protein